MRKWIDLFEAPIMSHELMGPEGEDFSSGTGFSDVDKKLLTSPKAVEKIYKAFSKTPHQFEIVFLNSDHVYGNEDDDNNNVDAGWTVAHKIGHAIQDHCYNTRWENTWSGNVRRIVSWINHIAEEATGEPYAGAAVAFHMHPGVYSLLTMKSSRDAKLTNDFEVFAEIMAQYLVSGKVSMSVDTALAPLVVSLNEEIRSLFADLEGYVLVEV